MTRCLDTNAKHRIHPLVCVFGCIDPAVAVVHTPQGCLCADNKYQPRCAEHLRKLQDTNEGDYEIVEDFRIGDNWL